MKYVLLPVLVGLALAGCATNRLSDAQRLDLYMAHAGEPVSKIRNLGAMSWDRVDDEHVLLSMRPKETWLMRVSGPCLDWGSASPTLRISSMGAFISTKIDRIVTDGSPMSCRIEEIRPVDLKAVRAAQEAAQAQASSGT